MLSKEKGIGLGDFEARFDAFLTSWEGKSPGIKSKDEWLALFIAHVRNLKL